MAIKDDKAQPARAMTQPFEGMQSFTHDELAECLSFLRRMNTQISGDLTRPALDRDTRRRLGEELERNETWAAEIAARLSLMPASPTAPAVTRRLERLPLEAEVVCKACGAHNRISARFCTACGQTLPGVGKERPTVQLAIRIVHGELSDVGVVRRNNEDSIFSRELELPKSLGGGRGWLGLVADGMGGASAGEVASGMTVELAPAYVLERVSSLQAEGVEAVLREGLEAANRAVFQRARATTGQRGMGTTATMLLLAPGLERCWLAHIGDSRAYLLNRLGITMKGARARNIVQLTTDHSVVARLIELGQLTPEEAAKSPHRSVLYRSLGTEPTTEVDTCSQQLQPGDRLLICSDGLNAHLADPDIAGIVLRSPDPQEACARLVAETKKRGAIDNVSVELFALE